MEDIKRIVEELNKKNRKLNLQILVGIEADEFLKNEKLSTFTSEQLEFFRQAKKLYKANRSKFMLAQKRDDLIEGITEGLEDFIAGRGKHFKTDEEMEAYLIEHQPR